VIPRLHYIASHTGRTDEARTIDLIRSALGAGVPAIQLRAKAGTDGERLDMARLVVSMCREAGALCIVNDRVDLALAAAADGVHVGPDDLPVADARHILGRHMVLGASARTPSRAREVVAAGASYIGVGPCFRTASKDGLPEPIGPEGLQAVADAVEVPVLAIGGVTADRVPELLAAGAHGVAVIGAIADAAEPGGAAKVLVELVGGLG
jgi:thiamine-phosphate pyrophosphorylase